MNIVAAQPFVDRPGAGEREDRARGARSRPNSPRQPDGEHRIDGEVEGQQHDRDPAEPRRHRRLEGEGGRDPVEPDDELPDAEAPADEQGAAQASGRARSVRTRRRRRAASAATAHKAANAKAEAAPTSSAIRKCMRAPYPFVPSEVEGRRSRASRLLLGAAQPAVGSARLRRGRADPPDLVADVVRDQQAAVARDRSRRPGGRRRRRRRGSRSARRPACPTAARRRRARRSPCSPTRGLRFHEPCWPTKAPCAYCGPSAAPSLNVSPSEAVWGPSA